MHALIGVSVSPYGPAEYNYLGLRFRLLGEHIPTRSRTHFHPRPAGERFILAAETIAASSWTRAAAMRSTSNAATPNARRASTLSSAPYNHQVIMA